MKRNIVAALTLLAALAAQAQIKFNLGSDSPLGKLQMAEIAISNMYVDTVNEERLVEDAIRGMLEKLDPHSNYATAKEVKALNEPLQGNFEGIGVQFQMVEDTLFVVQPTTDGPAERAGIVAGDRIVTVNDTAIAGVKMAQSDIMKRLRGKKGTKVKVGVVRRGVDGQLVFSLKRDKIPVFSINAAYLIRPETGYIRIDNFGATTHDEFVSAVTKLKGQGMKRLILDLQDNGGGYLQAAVNVAGEFLPRGQLIVYTEGRRQRRQDYTADGYGLLADVPTVVLINEYSASAAEIVTGALQDHDRAQVVGRRSFGKGLVQRPVELNDDSMIRLTVAHYYTPSGRCIQKPYKKGELKDYEMDIERRLKHGELTNPDSIHFDETLRYETLNKHRTVYGGGGIMPDHFVPLDTTRYTRFHRQAAAKNIVNTVNLRYLEQNRRQLQARYASFDDFSQHYDTPQAELDELRAEAARQDIRPKDDEEWQKSQPALRTQLKALVARDLWNMNEYFQVYNESNDIVRKAVDLITP